MICPSSSTGNKHAAHPITVAAASTCTATSRDLLCIWLFPTSLSAPCPMWHQGYLALHILRCLCECDGISARAAAQIKDAANTGCAKGFHHEGCAIFRNALHAAMKLTVHSWAPAPAIGIGAPRRTTSVNPAIAAIQSLGLTGAEKCRSNSGP
jgi:hypothetical protein